ncbi:IS21 family transposase [Calditrichota bacterium LG25]
MNKIRKVIDLYWNSSLSSRAIQRAIGLPSSTVSDYIKRFKETGLSFEQLSSLNDSQIYQRLFPEAQKKRGKIKPDFAKVNRELRKKNVTRQLLWEEYKHQYPEGMGYSQFCYHLKEWQKKLNISMRQTHKAGEKLFIDYSGLKGEITDRKSGQKRKVDIFVATLGASGYTYAEASEDQKLDSFIESHVKAFEFFEGVPDILVPDNLKSGVIKAHRYDPQINASYQDMADHYAVVVIPARPYSPKDKSKVELAVKLVQRWILAKIRNEIFFSVEELNQRIRGLLDYYNGKKIKKLGKSREALFLEIDKPALKALPSHRYEFRHVHCRRVNLDYHIEIENSYYSVPYQLAGKEVLVKYNRRSVQIFYSNKLIAVHARLSEVHQASTNKEHMPEAHRRYSEVSPSALIAQAKAIGPHTGRLINKIITEDKHPEKGYRSAYGILRAARQHKNDQEVELTSAKMLALNIKRVFHFETILKRKTWQSAEDEKALTPSIDGNSDNIRGSGYYH